MKTCIIIPCYNHNESLSEVLKKIPKGLHTIVVDDGSDVPVKAQTAQVLRLSKNSGKAKALQKGFEEALKQGFSHAITLDADNQHDPQIIPEFLKLSKENPESVIAGVRDFSSPEIPPKRKFMNKFSNFWFKFETKMPLGDTQCGYRLYPLALVKRLKLSCSRYAYEAELLVKTIWAGYTIIALPIPTIYTEESTANSHYKPFKDTLLISLMNTKLSVMRVFFPKFLRKIISIKKDA